MIKQRGEAAGSVCVMTLSLCLYHSVKKERQEPQSRSVAAVIERAHGAEKNVLTEKGPAVLFM